MHYANFSKTARITKLGILYPNFLIEDDGEVIPDSLLIPFEEFNDSDFITLENGNLLLLSQFELQRTLSDSLVLVKGDQHNGYILVLCTLGYDEDAVIFATPFCTAPEKVYRFSARTDCESDPVHEYLFVIRSSENYKFGHYSKKTNLASEIHLKWNYSKDEVSFRMSKPVNFNLFDLM